MKRKSETMEEILVRVTGLPMAEVLEALKGLTDRGIISPLPATDTHAAGYKMRLDVLKVLRPDLFPNDQRGK